MFFLCVSQSRSHNIEYRVQTLTRKQCPSGQRIVTTGPGPGFTWAGGAQSRGGGGGVAQHSSLRLRQQRPAPASTLWPV